MKEIPQITLVKGYAEVVIVKLSGGGYNLIDKRTNSIYAITEKDALNDVIKGIGDQLANKMREKLESVKTSANVRLRIKLDGTRKINHNEFYGNRSDSINIFEDEETVTIKGDGSVKRNTFDDDKGIAFGDFEEETITHDVVNTLPGKHNDKDLGEEEVVTL